MALASLFDACMCLLRLCMHVCDGCRGVLPRTHQQRFELPLTFPLSFSPTAYSNWGTAIDLYAPGGGIYSASPASRDAYVYMSGTSMATPMVAGGVACVLAGDPGKACTNAALVNKLTNPSVSVAQGGALQQSTRPNKPLFYLPSNANVKCP